MTDPCGDKAVLDDGTVCATGMPHVCHLWPGHDAWHECHCGESWWSEDEEEDDR